VPADSSVLQCAAVCCSVLQCVAVCCNMTVYWFKGGAVYCSCNASGFQYVAVCCGV